MIRIHRAAALAFALAFAASAAWAQSIAYPPELGPNLVAEAVGGTVVAFSSEASPNYASMLIDGSADEGRHWEPLWSSGRPYTVTLGLPEPATVSAIVFTSRPEGSSGGRPARITVFLGLDSADRLDPAGSYDLADEEMQVVRLDKPAKARFVHISIEDDYGDSGGEIGEIGVFGRATPTGFIGLEDSDALYMRDGSRLAGTAVMQTVDINAFGQKVSMPAADILWVEFGQEDGRLDRVMLKNGDAIPGIVTAARVSFKLAMGVVVDVARERVSAIGYRLKDDVSVASGSVTVNLRTGDRVSGRILGDKLTVIAPFGQVSVPTKDIESMREGEAFGIVVVTLRNGDEVRGYSGDESLRLDLDLGPVIAVHVSAVLSLARMN